MKNYEVYSVKELTYPEIIGYAYSFGEVLVLNNTKLETHKDDADRIYFEEGVLKSSFDDLLKDETEYTVGSPLGRILDLKSEKNKVLIPYASGTWKEIKDVVSEACLWIAGQGSADLTETDPLKLDKIDILRELRIYEDSNWLFSLNGDVCDRCVGYCIELYFPLPSRSLIFPEDIDKAMKKWEKM